jgi:hypothetical protein
VGILDDIAHVADSDADYVVYVHKLPPGTEIDQSHLDAFCAHGGDENKAREAVQTLSWWDRVTTYCCCCCP